MRQGQLISFSSVKLLFSSSIIYQSNVITRYGHIIVNQIFKRIFDCIADFGTIIGKMKGVYKYINYSIIKR